MGLDRYHHRKLKAAGLLLVVLLIVASAAQVTASGAVSGTHLLPRTNAAFKPAALQASAAFEVGDTLTVRAFNFRAIGGGRYQTSTTCRLVGEHCYIFVEDVVWDSPRVTQEGMEQIAAAFDSVTVGDPDRGIYELETELFGPVPDVDGDPRIVIVVLDILDSGSITGISFSGYFDVENQSPPISREILYLDMNPVDLGSALAKTTLAHEFQHLIHWLADPDESKWVDEGCSEYAELAAGFRDSGNEAGGAYLLLPNSSLTEWKDEAFDFDQTFLFTTYLAQRAGDGLFADLLPEQENGSTGLDMALEAIGSSLRFADVFADWMTALYLDGEGDRGLERIEVGSPFVDTLSVGEVTRTIRLWGIDYLFLDEPGGIRVDVSGMLDNTLTVSLIGDGPRGSYVTRRDLSPGETTRLTSFGADARVLAVTRSSGIIDDYTVSLSSILGDDPAASDFDDSGRVTFEDFLRFAQQFGKTPTDLDYDSAFDLDGDGRVAFGDFLTFAGHFGKVVP